MTAFGNNETTWERLDYRILRNSPVALYWNSEIWQKHIKWFEQNGYNIVKLDAEKWSSERLFHEDIEKGLQFPEYYGMNLDALNDCLRDIDFSDCDGLVIAIKCHVAVIRLHII